MKFFVAIYPGDARFHDFISPEDFCYGYLYSISSFNFRNIMKHFKGFTGDVIIDAGSFKFIEKKKLPLSQKQAFLRQIKIAKKLDTANKIIICHLDFPLMFGQSTREMQSRIDKTLENAIEFKNLFDTFDFSEKIYSMGIIQGYDEESIKSCYEILKDLKFDFYGIGGLAKMVQTAVGKWETAFERINYVIKLLGKHSKNLHIFGVNNLRILRKIQENKMNIHSVDSSSPTKGAWNSRIFISGIQKDFRKMNINALGCECPICAKMKDKVLLRGKKIYNNLRSIHNLYDLLKTLNLKK
ncbi:MAG: hypothetical protein QXS37_04090 [Candidatus Aenigmatarchaeota archaeon]